MLTYLPTSKQLSLGVLSAAVLTISAQAAVTLSSATSEPLITDFDQFNLATDAPVPGGFYNDQAFSDNSGPPGQTFTTPAGAPSTLVSFSLKGAAQGGENFGGVNNSIWGIRVSAVSGMLLTPIFTKTDVGGVDGLVGDEWLTWTFSESDVLTLAPSSTYAFEVFSAGGYMGFDAALDPAAYAGGTAFNSTSSSRSFNSVEVQERGYDRTFHVDLVPEPSAAVALISGLAMLGMRRSRRSLVAR